MSRYPRALLVFLCLAPAPALAESEQEKEAAEYLKRATDFLNDGDYQQAELYFRLAGALSPEASGPYAGMGLAQRGRGACDEAIPNLKEYLSRAPKGVSAGDVKAALAACESAESRLTARASQNGVEVSADGGLAQAAPRTFSLKPGPHTLTFKKKGYGTVTLRVDVEGGQRYELPAVTLQDAKAAVTEDPRRAAKHFTILAIPATGRMGFEATTGVRLSVGMAAEVPFGDRARIYIGGQGDVGVLRDSGEFIEPTARLSSRLGWDRPFRASRSARVGVDATVGLLYHRNQFEDEVEGVITEQQLLLALRVAATARFRLSESSSLVFEPLALSVSPPDIGSLFGNIRTLEIFSVGVERRF
jgi:hypothetical protein